MGRKTSPFLITTFMRINCILKNFETVSKYDFVSRSNIMSDFRDRCNQKVRSGNFIAHEPDEIFYLTGPTPNM